MGWEWGWGRQVPYLARRREGWVCATPSWCEWRDYPTIDRSWRLWRAPPPGMMTIAAAAARDVTTYVRTGACQRASEHRCKTRCKWDFCPRSHNNTIYLIKVVVCRYVPMVAMYKIPPTNQKFPKYIITILPFLHS